MQNNWQHKIFTHEEMPPHGAWENIAKLLDKADGKLNKQIAPVVSMPSNAKSYWKIAAAACLIAITSTAIWFNSYKTSSIKNEIASADVNTNNKSATKEIASTLESPIKKITNDKVISKSKNNVEIVLSTSSPAKNSIANNYNNNITTTNKAIIKNNNTNVIEIAQVEKSGSFATNPALINPEKIANSAGEIPNDISLLNTPNGYVSFVGPNGQEVRVSSKFSNLLGFMDGADPETQENLDKIISESDIWRTKFKKWRNKMANNNIAPSPSNFMDIIALSKLLSTEGK